MRRGLRRALDWNGPLVSGLGLAAALGAGLVLIRLSVAQAALLLPFMAVAAGTLAEPLVGLVAGLFLGLLRAYLQTEVPQVPAQIGHLFVALAVAAWAGRALARRRLAANPGKGIALPLLAFVAATWLSLCSAADLANYGLPEFAKWVEVLLVFLVVADRARPRHVPWLLGAVLLTGVFQAAVGLYQFGLRAEGPEHFLIPGSDFYRAYGTFEQPNPYAGYIGMTLSLAVGVVVGLSTDRGTHDERDRPRPLVSSLVFPLLLLAAASLAGALGASWSRGAWIGFGASLVAIVVAVPRRTRRGFLLVVLLAMLVLALHATGRLPSAIVTRLTDFAASLRLEDVRGVGINDANYPVIERLAHWQAALEMWRSHPWTGVGLGCYEPAYPGFALINWPVALGHAHNIYLNLLAETGVVGLIAYVALWAAVFWRTWRATREWAGLARGVALGLLGAWTHLTVHHLFDNLYVNNVHLFVGLLLGLLAVAGSGRPERADRPIAAPQSRRVTT